MRPEPFGDALADRYLEECESLLQEVRRLLPLVVETATPSLRSPMGGSGGGHGSGHSDPTAREALDTERARAKDALRAARRNLAEATGYLRGARARLERQVS